MQGGANLEAMRELAGHSKLHTAQRYVHATGAALRDTIGRLFPQVNDLRGVTRVVCDSRGCLLMRDRPRSGDWWKLVRQPAMVPRVNQRQPLDEPIQALRQAPLRTRCW